MFPYDPYHDAQNNSAEHPNTLPQTTAPRSYNANSGYEWKPGEAPKPKKERKAPKYLAAALGIALLSSAAGGGTALYILQSQSVPAGQSTGAVSTVLQTTNDSGISPASNANTIAAVAQTASDSVVEIDIKAEQEQGFFMGSQLVEGSGSGVIISEDGYIVTNNHVVEGSESIVVRTKDGTEYNATLIGTDPQTDLAVIKVEATGLAAATFANSDNIQVGDLAVAIGNPLGELGGTVTSGIISATGREVSIDGGSMTLLQTSAAINPGNSGGGLFDSNGHLIGIVNAKSAGVEIEGLGFAIPANTVQKVVPDIIDKGYVTGRAAMGIQVVSISDARTAMMYNVDQMGVYVADPGDNATLKAGDRFVFIDGESITTGADVTKVLQAHEAGDTISVSLVRDGKEVQTEVTLREQVPEQIEEPQQPNEL